MVSKVVVLLAFGLACVGTQASDIFKWVDEKGRVHYGESVPEQYQRSATKLVLADAMASDGLKDLSCEARKRRYRESQECFAPYRTATGGIKRGAFQHCVELKQPMC